VFCLSQRGRVSLKLARLAGLSHRTWTAVTAAVTCLSGRLGLPTMPTMDVGLRVSDLERSLAFYTALGYAVVGTVEGTAFGSLTMLRLPGDGFVTIELVYDPARGAVDLGTGPSHLVIQVESLDAALADLATQAIVAESPELPAGTDGPRTSWITAPNGYRIELVQ
jgi:lactoylglutathione lyase